MNRNLLAAGLALFFALPSSAVQGEKPLRDRSSEGLALGGFDPVSYFQAGGAKAEPGVAAHEYALDGVNYRFVNKEHKAWFMAEPERYAPAFGGFDAAAMALGRQQSAPPEHFRVDAARLFVFAKPDDSAKFDAAARERADAAWKQLSGEAARGVLVDDSGAGTGWNLGKQDLAIDGFDPVSYFPEGGGAPAKGDAKIETQLDGARYRFASEAHRALFLSEPQRYRPKYGGWCAYAMADGDDVEIDPRSFLIEHGRLLLFYKGLFADTRAKWLPKSAELATQADSNWAKRKRKP
jgi:YHS domain-containing protein